MVIITGTDYGTLTFCVDCLTRIIRHVNLLFGFFFRPAIIAALMSLRNEPDIQCVEGVLLWRESTSVINDELLKGYIQRGGKTNEFIAGYLPIFVAPIFLPLCICSGFAQQ
jgi:hypothetical protein